MRRTLQEDFKLKFPVLNKLIYTLTNKLKHLKRIQYSHKIETLDQIVFCILQRVQQIYNVHFNNKINRMYCRVLETLVLQRISNNNHNKNNNSLLQHSKCKNTNNHHKNLRVHQHQDVIPLQSLSKVNKKLIHNLNRKYLSNRDHLQIMSLKNQKQLLGCHLFHL